MIKKNMTDIHLIENDDINETDKMHTIENILPNINMVKEAKFFIESYTKAIELNPDDASYYHFRGLSYISLNQYEKSIEDFDKAIELEPDDANYYYLRGLSYLNLKQYEKSIEDFDKAIELKPVDASYYRLRGLSFFNLNQYEKAIDDFNKAIELKLDDVISYALRGQIYFNLSQYEEAIEAFDKAIELNHVDASYYRLRGLSYSNLNQYEKAIEDLNKAIELNLDDVTSYGVRGLSYFRLKHYEKAIDDLSKAIELEHDIDCNIVLMRAVAFLAINKTEEAFSDLVFFKDNMKDYFKKSSSEIEKGVSLGLFEKKIMISINHPIMWISSIILESTHHFMLRILELFFDLTNYEFYSEDYQEYTKLLDDYSPEIQDYPARLIELNKKLFGDSINFFNKDNNQLFYDMTKKSELIDHIIDKIIEENYSKELSLEDYKKYFEMFNLFRIVSKDLTKKLMDKIIVQEEEKTKAIIKAKDELMQSFSHKMKNSFPKSVANLENLEAGLPQVHDEIHSAIKQIQHLEKLAHAINFSFKGNIEDVKYDIDNPVNAKSLKQIIVSALDNSIENLLDKSGVYSIYTSQYFDLNTKKEARNNYNSIANKDYDSIKKFISEYFLDLTVDFGKSENYEIGNSRHSLIKFSEVIEELVFNAFKYAATATQRYIKVNIEEAENEVILMIENSCNEANNQLKTSGLGRQIVKNTLDALQIKYEIKSDDKSYTVIVRFKNLWTKK